MKYRAHRW